MKKNIHLLIAWQSLVVPSYRSFFERLSEKLDWGMTLLCPAEFVEAGNQRLPCAPFDPPFDGSAGPRRAALVLPACVPHVQAVWYRGVVGRLARLRRELDGSYGRGNYELVVVNLAEPYSLTALSFPWAVRAAFGPNFRSLCFALQNIRRRLRFPLGWAQRRVFKRSSAILSLGAEQTEVLRGHGYGGTIIPFPLWYDSRIFKPLERPAALALMSGALGGLPEGKPVVGYCGSLFREKGLDELFACLEKRAPAWKDRLVLLVAGRGPLAGEVEARCLRLSGLGYDSRYLGSLAPAQMPGFFSLVDLLAVPSRTEAHWKEQFGRVIVEAQACGALVLGSDSGAIPEVVGDPELIFRERDPDDLGRILEKALRRVESARGEGRRAAGGGRYSDHACAAAFAVNLRALVEA